MDLLALSFLAGALTILTPCVLPVLPIVIGSGAIEKSNKKIIAIILSLCISIIFISLLLKTGADTLGFSENFWKNFSATIILVFSFHFLFPQTWAKILHEIKKFLKKIIPTNKNQNKKINIFSLSKKNNLSSQIILGLSLGPIFSTCSPTYFIILATVLPESFYVGFINLLAFCLGVSLVMFLVAYASKGVFRKMINLSNPNGWFKKILGIIFVLVAIGIFSGYDKKIEAYLVGKGYLGATEFEIKVLKDIGM